MHILGRVAVVRTAAAYSYQTFPWTICRSVRRRVGLSSALCKNAGLDSDAVRHHRSDGSRHEAGSGVWGSVHGKGYFWGKFGARHCNQWGLDGVRVDFRSDAALFQNYLGQICSCNFYIFIDTLHIYVWYDIFEGDAAALLAGHRTCDLQVRVLVGHHCVVALGKLLTPVCFCQQVV